MLPSFNLPELLEDLLMIATGNTAPRIDDGELCGSAVPFHDNATTDIEERIHHPHQQQSAAAGVGAGMARSGWRLAMSCAVAAAAVALPTPPFPPKSSNGQDDARRKPRGSRWSFMAVPVLCGTVRYNARDEG